MITAAFQPRYFFLHHGVLHYYVDTVFDRTQATAPRPVPSGSIDLCGRSFVAVRKATLELGWRDPDLQDPQLGIVIEMADRTYELWCDNEVTHADWLKRLTAYNLVPHDQLLRRKDVDEASAAEEQRMHEEKESINAAEEKRIKTSIASFRRMNPVADIQQWAGQRIGHTGATDGRWKELWHACEPEPEPEPDLEPDLEPEPEPEPELPDYVRLATECQELFEMFYRGVDYSSVMDETDRALKNLREIEKDLDRGQSDAVLTGIATLRAKLQIERRVVHTNVDLLRLKRGWLWGVGGCFPQLSEVDLHAMMMAFVQEHQVETDAEHEAVDWREIRDGSVGAQKKSAHRETLLRSTRTPLQPGGAFTVRRPDFDSGEMTALLTRQIDSDAAQSVHDLLMRHYVLMRRVADDCGDGPLSLVENLFNRGQGLFALSCRLVRSLQKETRRFADATASFETTNFQQKIEEWSSWLDAPPPNGDEFCRLGEAQMAAKFDFKQQSIFKDKMEEEQVLLRRRSGGKALTDSQVQELHALQQKVRETRHEWRDIQKQLGKETTRLQKLSLGTDGTDGFAELFKFVQMDESIPEGLTIPEGFMTRQYAEKVGHSRKSYDDMGEPEEAAYLQRATRSNANTVVRVTFEGEPFVLKECPLTGRPSGASSGGGSSASRTVTGEERGGPPT